MVYNRRYKTQHSVDQSSECRHEYDLVFTNIVSCAVQMALVPSCLKDTESANQRITSKMTYLIVIILIIVLFFHFCSAKKIHLHKYVLNLKKKCT